MERGHLGAGAVERHRRAGHVGNRDVHRHRQLVGEPTASIDQHHELQQDRRADEGEVLRDGVAERAGDLLDSVDDFTIGTQPLRRIGDVGGELAEHARDLVVLSRRRARAG